MDFFLQMLSESGTNILEPIMSLEVVAPEEYLSSVLSDLGGRRADIGRVNVRGKSKVSNLLANVFCFVSLFFWVGRCLRNSTF